ncbi:MAG: ABC transporter permease, partial [Chloroflexota bacterium]
MNLTESVRVALRALGANKLRSSLTMLGMIIGVGAVIALMSIGQGVQASVTAQIKGLGSNLLFITPGAQVQGGVRAQAGTAPTLTLE